MTDTTDGQQPLPQHPPQPTADEQELLKTGEKFTDTPPEDTAPQPQETQQQAIKRRYKENTSFYSDLFKLGVAKMLQWKGWTKDSRNAPRDEHGNLNEDWVHTEHCHYFHTKDSNGRVLEYCQRVGQHVHKMKVNYDSKNPEDIISVDCISGPLKWVVDRKYGKPRRVLAPVPHDDHRHDTFYVKSDKLSRPDMNAEAAKVIGRAGDAETSKKVFDEDGRPLPDLAVRGG